MILYEGDRAFELKVCSQISHDLFSIIFDDSDHQAPSSEVRIFQDVELNQASGRSHVPSRTGNSATSITSNSINLRKQLLLVMRQLSDDIESVSESFLYRFCVFFI
jgi:hypothetical protein